MSQHLMTDDMALSDEVLRAFSTVQVLAMDVDGVLTDGTLGYDSAGHEQKRFHVADGMGMTVLRLAGISIAWFSGRESAAVSKRAVELRIADVFQGVKRKDQILAGFLETRGISPANAAFIGDDWNDLPPFDIVGLRIAVANADPMVRAAAHYTTVRRGGEGAVREVCDLILEAQNRRVEMLHCYLSSLKETPSDGSAGQ